jgi:hypothetical protein
MPPSRGRVRGSKGSMHASHETEDVSRESCEDVLSARVIPESASYTASSASTPQTQDTTVTRRSRKYAAPRDASFREEVLESRGIIIKGNTLSLPDPFVHFASGRTTETNYKELPGLENLHIWLQTDPDFLKEISEEYSCMVQNSLCEAEFATFGKERLLKAEPRRFTIPEDRRWRTERMIDLVAKPSSREKWEAPPLLHSHKSDQSYNFDIRPDCAYWLSLRAFNKDWRDRVEEYILVMYDRVTCPYFTVEFKRDDSGDTTAENQVATAGALALYNRYLLRSTCLRQTKSVWRDQDKMDIRHYNATLRGSKFALWCLEPVLLENGDWRGCTMSRVFRSQCHTERGTRSFVQWVNEIHAWGLEKYGPACQRDLKRCLHETGVRVSDIGGSERNKPDSVGVRTEV